MSKTRDKANTPFTNFQSTGIDDNADATAITIDSSENVGIGTTSPSTTLDVNGTITANRIIADSTTLVVDATNNRVGIGTASPDRELTVGSVANARIGILSSDNSTGASQLQFGDTDNSQVGRIYYEHSDDTMRFHTGNVERARISSSGFHIGGTGSANALDDYEEGSFTPSLDIETGSNISVTTIQGYYRKIGNLVAFTIFCVWDKTAGSANMKFTGLPFTCSNQTNLSSQAVNWLQGAYTDQGAFFGGRVFGSSTDVYFVDSKHGSFNSNFDTNNAGRIANTTGIRTYVNGTYFTT